MGADEGVRLSRELGLALQLTNILRDIIEDAGRDRVYLPADMLADAGAGGDGVEDIVTAPALSDLCEALAARAAGHFKAADGIIADAAPATVRPAVMMMQVYRRTLEKLRNRGWADLEQDVGPSKLEKLLIAVRYGVFG